MATEGDKENMVPLTFRRQCVWKGKFLECQGIISESIVYRTPEQAAKIRGGVIVSHTVCDNCVAAGRTLFRED